MHLSYPKKRELDLDELLLELVSYGVDEVEEDGEEIIISGEGFFVNGAIQSFLESGYEITSSGAGVATPQY